MDLNWIQLKGLLLEWAQRQLKFVVVLSQPQLPAEPDQNWRWQAFLASVGIIVVSWGVGGFILNAMKKS